MEYLVRQPRTLQEVALEEFVEWIELHAIKFIWPLLDESETLARDVVMWKLISKEIEMIRTSLSCKLPKWFHNRLADLLLSALVKLEHDVNSKTKSYHSTLFWRLIETIFTDKLTRLSLYERGSKIFFQSLCSKWHMLPCLAELELRISCTSRQPDMSEVDIMKLLKEFQCSLKKFTLHTSETYGRIKINNILKYIVNNCKLIEELDMEFNILDSSDHFNLLAQLPNLTRLEVCPLGSRKLATILMSCKKLQHIKNINLALLASALEYIATLQPNTEIKLQLQSHLIVNNFLAVPLHQMQLFVEMCTRIHEMTISNHVIEQDSLMYLENLKNLENLTLLSRFNVNTDHGRSLLQTTGLNLVHLCLDGVRQIDLNALMFIGEKCPNLQSFILNNCTFVESNDLLILAKHQNSAEFPSFKKLLKLSVHAPQPFYYSIVYFLLSNCKIIEHIFLANTPVTNELLLRVLDVNPLMYLKEFKIEYNRYLRQRGLFGDQSQEVIDQIIRNSLNCPEIMICHFNSF